MRLTLRCVPFSRPNLLQQIQAASGLPKDSEPDQIKYLAAYLAGPEANARALIVEHPYVDRHYLEEYTGYYASALRAPPHKTTRIHIFASEIDDQALGQRIEDATRDYDAARKIFQDAYLGFVVVRPLPSAPIGRTILRPYRGRPSRCFAAAATPHRVHLAGFELEVQGVPFQQQDQAVGACATTAIWSALARVMRADGNRAVTPLAVTAAATRYLLHGRALPANAGLDMSQILGAIRELGYSPHVLTSRNDGDHGEFLLALKSYLRSGIPVILRIRHEDSDEAHAITVVGFRESDQDETAADLVLPLGDERELRSVGVSRLYVHDDRLGPYARAVWLPVEPGERPALRLVPGSSGLDKKFASKASIWGAIAPLYPKLRLTAEDLIGYAADFLPLMSFAAKERRSELRVEPRFVLGGQYLRDLYGLALAPARARELATTALLSRYVGLVRFCLGDAWFADILFDTTDIRRDGSLAAPVLAMVPRDAALVDAFQTLLDQFTEADRALELRPIVA